ncbi:LysR family transcriptional regulator [Simiduia curdlanivorans]|uniref:LysR family transcriptional regulator n=1 Tax=Simiduia curdlanivorans TaxID=1492769 RepID=A0ABV8VAE8_9GAMM|nr:LysR family transcriptional regulator [Simiduia curdlanivorans]MDN3639442.1 LysR family transcriptional regulator [Simiduia curdlanivorans]
MDTQSLEAFCAVAECNSFSEAATKLFLTQPAVSKRVANLESQLNCRLFDRIGKRVQLTQAGLLLQPKAQHILQALADSKRLLAELGNQVSGKLYLATSHHIGLHRLPPLLKSFSQRYPEVELVLQFLDSERAYQEVLQGKHDLAIVTLEPVDHQQVARDIWWTDDLLFVCAKDHALAQLNSLSLDQLSDVPAILPSPNTHTTQVIQRLFDDAGARLNVSMTTQSLDTIKMMTSIGLGWSLLPKTLMSKELMQLAPKVDGTPLQINRQLGCIHHPQRSLSNAALAFIKLCKTQIA